MVLAVIQFVLLLAGMFAFVYFIWHMKADFYEDAMAGARQREDILLAASEKRQPISMADEGKKKKEVVVKERIIARKDLKQIKDIIKF